MDQRKVVRRVRRLVTFLSAATRLLRAMGNQGLAPTGFDVQALVRVSLQELRALLRQLAKDRDPEAAATPAEAGSDASETPEARRKPR